MHNFLNGFALLFTLVLAANIGLKLSGIDVIWKDIAVIMIIFLGGFVGLFVHSKFVMKGSKSPDLID
ncbi:hypothetical protein OHW31_07480 [Acinetobacter baumannii]|uniref:hypothetical protein n=1 Tax=Acinetobacter calcoaceticus/baumannii complex TaxID=909768 RepID=UPI001E5937F5|nr:MULTISPECIES: hypothetical protein [Acinetobacter calcoaceticus/baumannii complex]MDC4524127.1 hypothetical protein [Acinetobacter baumannii]MDC4667695.1 hypothetical protein [Acinetobacter baumannii]MDC4769549.1 hypothetical protein [Acinetobacter baumannii]MDC4794079.1 hypothetical protein [Acinetobacter baumannii]MDC5067111.1 hypothetical protein [Acinetobacter baumannii]